MNVTTTQHGKQRETWMLTEYPARPVVRWKKTQKAQGLKPEAVLSLKHSEADERIKYLAQQLDNTQAAHEKFQNQAASFEVCRSGQSRLKSYLYVIDYDLDDNVRHVAANHVLDALSFAHRKALCGGQIMIVNKVGVIDIKAASNLEIEPWMKE